MESGTVETVDRERVEHLEGGRLSELYVRHAPAAVRLAYLLTGDRELAADLVHEALLRLAGRFVHVRRPGDVEAPIAFVRVGDPPSGSSVATVDIWYVSPAGGEPSRITHDGVSSNPVWSPSGAMVAFARWSGAEKGDFSGDIYVMNSEGSGVRQITSGPADDSWPAWQPS